MRWASRDDKRATNDGPRATYLVAYEYVPPGGLSLTREMDVRAKHDLTIEPGTPVPVLYDAANPERSVVYDLADYEAV